MKGTVHPFFLVFAFSKVAASASSSVSHLSRSARIKMCLVIREKQPIDCLFALFEEQLPFPAVRFSSLRWNVSPEFPENAKSFQSVFFGVLKCLFRHKPSSEDRELKAVAELFEVSSYGFSIIVIAYGGAERTPVAHPQTIIG